jgi:hypothetical protein
MVLIQNLTVSSSHFVTSLLIILSFFFNVEYPLFFEITFVSLDQAKSIPGQIYH